MIDVRPTGKNKVEFVCEECEKLYGVTISMAYDTTDRSVMARTRRKKLVDFFFALHEPCGSAEADKRINDYLGVTSEEDWQRRVKLVNDIYASNPSITFEEAKKLYHEIKSI